jgi:hypothetical protein
MPQSSVTRVNTTTRTKTSFDIEPIHYYLQSSKNEFGGAFWAFVMIQ